jgi:hypothetical protein
MKKFLEFIKEDISAESKLLAAILHNDEDGIKKAIKEGANLNKKIFHNNMTPLIYCVYNQDNHCAKILIDAGADINIADESNYTPLLLSAYLGNKEMVKILFSNKNVDVTRKTDKGRSFIDMNYDDLVKYYKTYDFQKQLLNKNENNFSLLPKKYLNPKIKEEYPYLIAADELNLL